jgi:hypothetical protein
MLTDCHVYAKEQADRCRQHTSWPHELAHELAAFDLSRFEAPSRRRHGADTRGRKGATDESARRDVVGDGEEEGYYGSLTIH